MERIRDEELVSMITHVSIDDAKDMIAKAGNLYEFIIKDEQLSLCLELVKRAMDASLKRGEKFSDSKTVKQFLMSKIGMLEHESFYCFYLDSTHRLICHENLFTGTIDSSPVFPREVLKKVIKYNAKAVVFAHNHPSGDTNPSLADIQITKRLVDCLSIIDVRVLDHFIIGRDLLSMSDAGHI